METSTVHDRKENVAKNFHGIIGSSPKMQELFGLITKLAEDDMSTVLIQGESGTGKELVAKAIHANSPRHAHNFVPVNCAAIPDDLLESELFGYVKGAFTGATGNKTGRIEYADGGTLFLDEIGDMKPILQAKLLRVLQEKEFEPVGGLKPIKINVRVVAATHRNIEELVAKGQFREDLYYRLSVVPLVIPALRDRREDIPLLIDYFLKNINQRRKNGLLGFDDHAMAALMEYHWRGNVRELENLVQHMAVLHAGSEVTLEDLPEKYRAHVDRDLLAAAVEKRKKRQQASAAPNQASTVSPPVPDADIQDGAAEGVDFNSLVNDYETQLILQALFKTKGNKKEAARLLNLKRTTLLEKIKKKKIQDQWKN